MSNKLRLIINNFKTNYNLVKRNIKIKIVVMVGFVVIALLNPIMEIKVQVVKFFENTK